MDSHREPRTAPFYSIPPRRLISVEHPAVIRNIDKAVDTLQGNAGIHRVRHSFSPTGFESCILTDTTQILHPLKADAPATLILRPEDALARPLYSTSCASNNVLLRITVPKRTGRKRKRGSDGPFLHPGPEEHSGTTRRRTAKDLLRSLQDNPSRYTIDPVGRVERTHVFRGIF